MELCWIATSVSKKPPAIRRFQIGLLLLFLAINVALLALAQPTVFDGNLLHPAYAFAPDGNRYWHPALSLLRDGTFSYIASDGQWHSLARGGPIPPVFYAIFISTFGFDIAPYYFIPVQCALLYALGLQARTFAGLFGANKNLVQALITLNPNLIGIAHFAQSEALFCFSFAALLILVAQLLVSKENSGLVSLCILIGVLSGVAVLIRPASFFYALLLPALVSVLYSWPGRYRPTVKLKEATFVLVLIATSSAIIIAPWAVRNSLTLGHPSVVQGSADRLEDSLTRMLVKNGVGNNAEVRNLLRSDLQKVATKNNLHQACFDQAVNAEVAGNSCNWQITEAYIRLIASQPIGFIINGLVFATVSTYFAGGATAIANVLGVGHSSEEIVRSEFVGLTTFREFVMKNLDGFSSYILLALITGIFASLCRLLGLLGILTAVQTRISPRLQLLCIVTVVIFSATFLFTGVSRFRAPLEIILMTYAALGIALLCRTSKKNRAIVKDRIRKVD